MTISEQAWRIIHDRYAHENENSWEDIAQRVGTTVANRDSDGGKCPDYVSIIRDCEFIPAGRILRNMGRKFGSIFNCNGMLIGDSREEIGTALKHAFILWGEGGGIGFSLNALRPSGDPVRKVGGVASGPVSFLHVFNKLAETVEIGGQRRAAALALLNVTHPDFMEYINAKCVDGDLRTFNISAGITQEFIDAVYRGDKWTFKFQNRDYHSTDAQDLWYKIVHNAWRIGDPGFINIDRLNINNSWYFAPIVSTNPCGEAPLEHYGVCNLGSVVLPKFVDSAGRVQWARLEEVIEYGVRFLDTCIDINEYSLHNTEQAAKRGRRIGLGVMGLADLLFKLRLRYGSDDATAFIEKLFKRIRNYAYKASIKLATEKGSFPAFDANLYCKSAFIKKLSPTLRRDIRQHGIRNVTLLAMAPTGTISLIPEVTSGIEPLTYKAWRSHDSKRYYVHPILRDLYRDSADNPHWFVDSDDLQVEDHIEMQVIVQKYADGAVSKTINLPANYDPTVLSGLILESLQNLKGLTLYRSGSRGRQPLRKLAVAELSKFLCREEAVDVTSCARGGCGL